MRASWRPAASALAIITACTVVPAPEAEVSTRPLVPTAGTTQPSPVTTVQPTTTSGPAGTGSGVDIPWGSVPGLLQFRGNPSRAWYGTGPIPESPRLLWRFPRDEPMCGLSTVGGEARTWCGTGWTGQPVVWERPDGVVEVIFGAYDRAVHFLDAATGTRTRPDFPTGDIIKGSVTLDPDGFPLLYFGSRDNRLRVVALDRDPPAELWALDSADHPGIWNNDWDGNPVVIDDLLYEGGENGLLFVVRLNRSIGADGLVAVAPEILVSMPGWTDGLLAAVGDRNASIESSVAVAGDRLYFTNSAGRVAGVDLGQVESGQAPIVFDFWAGDDIDATPVVDAEGNLYVAVELERFLPRAEEVGQLLKLDPSRPDDPLVWGIPVPPGVGQDVGGLWATPALGAGHLYASTHSGRLLAVDVASGEVVWEDQIGSHAWSSPVIADGRMVVSVDCEAGGGLRAYDLSDPAAPRPIWDLSLGTGCIESTPAVWDGGIYVGARDGHFYAFGD